MPMRRGTGGTPSRSARLADAITDGKGRGGPFGKRDQIAVNLARAGLNTAVTRSQAAAILDKLKDQ